MKQQQEDRQLDRKERKELREAQERAQKKETEVVQEKMEEHKRERVVEQIKCYRDDAEMEVFIDALERDLRAVDAPQDQ